METKPPNTEMEKQWGHITHKNDDAFHTQRHTFIMRLIIMRVVFARTIFVIPSNWFEFERCKIFAYRSILNVPQKRRLSINRNQSIPQRVLIVLGRNKWYLLHLSMSRTRHFLHNKIWHIVLAHFMSARYFCVRIANAKCF